MTTKTNGDNANQMMTWLLQAICIFFLILALNPKNPYGFYIFLRWLCFPIFAFLAHKAFGLGKTKWCAAFIIAAITYNPLMRLHLQRDVWTLLNIITIVIAAVSIFSLRQEKGIKTNPPDPFERRWEEIKRQEKAERAKSALAWIVGVASTIALSGIGIAFLNYLGVQTEFENEDEMAPAVAAIIILSAMTAARIGMAVYTGSADANISEEGKLNFKAWFLGIAIWGIFGAILYALITGEGFLVYTLKYLLLVVGAIVIGCIMMAWRDNRKKPTELEAATPDVKMDAEPAEYSSYISAAGRKPGGEDLQALLKRLRFENDSLIAASIQEGRGVSRDAALHIARMAAEKNGMTVEKVTSLEEVQTQGFEPGIVASRESFKDCWIAHLDRNDGFSGIRESYILLISKSTGEIEYEGGAGDEG